MTSTCNTDIRAVKSGSAALRLREARHFLDQFEAGREVLLLGASRGSVDDLARAVALEKGATFGLHRLSFTQLAARLALLELAAHGSAPTTALGHEAVATRAAFEALNSNALQYFAPISRTPGFPKALARTLLELRLGAVDSNDLARLQRSGRDLAALLDQVEALLSDAGAGDRAALFQSAIKGLHSPASGWASMPLLLLDVPFYCDVEAEFLWALVQRGAQALITVPDGDTASLKQIERRGIAVELLEQAETNDLTQVARCLFSKEPPPERSRTGELVWFSAPGEGRECIEIARRILREAERGVRFDEMAIIVRSAQHYVGLLEHAVERASIPAYFDRGTRRPDPAGRAFLAVLSCAIENFSARRFAEYLSLAQVPSLDRSGKAFLAQTATWVASRDDVFGVLSEAAADGQETSDGPGEASQDGDGSGDNAVIAGSLRAPWKWERLLVESAVIGGSKRWARRLDGLAAEYKVQIEELASEDPDSPRISRLERERQNLSHLRAFALPLIEEMSDWPEQATWGDWMMVV
jgi:hypothetical protein